jgi:hypothetical protein
LPQTGEEKDRAFREGCMKVRLFLDEDIHLALAPMATASSKEATINSAMASRRAGSSSFS